ncbi:MAG: MFS transporter [Acidimicrobiia bacterium]
MGVIDRSDERLLTPSFVKLCLTSLLFWGSVIGLNPVLAPFVKDELGGSTIAVGIVASSVGVAAIFSRRWIGPIGDRHGRRPLLIGGALLASLGILGTLLVSSVPLMMPTRFLLGVGQAAFMVGLTTSAMDLVSPLRRGEAMSLVLMFVHFGGASGPLLMSWLRNAYSYDAVWIAAACGAAAAALVASKLRLPAHAPVAPPPPGERTRVIHPLGVWPGIVFALGQIGVIGFLAYAALYAKEVGLGKPALVFAVSSLVVALMRLFGSRLPDTLGTARAGTLALAFMMGGLGLAAAWQTPVGLLVSTAVISCGTALTFPTFVTAAVDVAAENERSVVVSTFTMFGDVSGALGGFVFGAMVALANYPAAFLTYAASAALATFLLHTQLVPSMARARHSDSSIAI